MGTRSTLRVASASTGIAASVRAEAWVERAPESQTALCEIPAKAICASSTADVDRSCSLSSRAQPCSGAAVRAPFAARAAQTAACCGVSARVSAACCSGSRPSRRERTSAIGTSQLLGMSCPTVGSSGGSHRTSCSRRFWSATIDMHPPGMDVTHGTSSSWRESCGWREWPRDRWRCSCWRSRARTHAVASAAAVSSASGRHILLSAASMRARFHTEVACSRSVSSAGTPEPAGRRRPARAPARRPTSGRGPPPRARRWPSARAPPAGRARSRLGTAAAPARTPPATRFGGARHSRSAREKGAAAATGRGGMRGQDPPCRTDLKRLRETAKGREPNG
eukprot:6205138-Pleurochrysis_carterae.AAC.2